jgi:hypothetical protein
MSPNLLLLSTLLVASAAASSSSQRPLAFATPPSRSKASTSLAAAQGLYQKFAEHCWSELGSTGWLQNVDLKEEFSQNVSPAKGFPEGTVVKMTNRAMVPKESSLSSPTNLIKYARYALLETIHESTDGVQSKGIQVLNFVVLPSDATNLPVLGIDLVSLPGDKHLLLLDAQPMVTPNPYDSIWKDWHSKHATDDDFPWGGDFPEAVAKYVSPNALWTRLSGKEGADLIQTKIYDAFQEHISLYLKLLRDSEAEESIQGDNDQPNYIDYRRNNDPAAPMLKALYGPEWTAQVLEEVLFPSKL